MSLISWERILFCVIVKPALILAFVYPELTSLGTETYQYYNSSSSDFGNCSSYTIAHGSRCTCHNSDGDRVLICCNSSGFRCCYCDACSTSCWKNQWQFISLAQVGLSSLLMIVILGMIAVLFRFCNGMKVSRPSGISPLIRDIPSRISISSVQQYIIERLQDRPPQYNDISDAPPVYDAVAPNSRIAECEAPPSYTSRQETTDNTRNIPLPSAPLDASNITTRRETVAHHM